MTNLKHKRPTTLFVENFIHGHFVSDNHDSLYSLVGWTETFTSLLHRISSKKSNWDTGLCTASHRWRCIPFTLFQPAVNATFSLVFMSPMLICSNTRLSVLVWRLGHLHWWVLWLVFTKVKFVKFNICWYALGHELYVWNVTCVRTKSQCVAFYSPTLIRVGFCSYGQSAVRQKHLLHKLTAFPLHLNQTMWITNMAQFWRL